MKIKKIIIIRRLNLLALSFFMACTSLPYERFGEVKEGMYKSEVLNLLGSPDRVNRRTQTHVWKYRFYNENEKRVTKEIQLKNDKVIYVGPEKTLERVINPNETAYTKEQLNQYIKEGAEEEKKKTKKKKMDTYDMQQEMMRDLKEDGNFKPVK